MFTAVKNVKSENLLAVVLKFLTDFKSRYSTLCGSWIKTGKF